MSVSRMCDLKQHSWGNAMNNLTIVAIVAIVAMYLWATRNRLKAAINAATSEDDIAGQEECELGSQITRLLYDDDTHDSNVA